MDNKTVERKALLFEAGNYPDKGINVTEADLDTLVKNFKDDAPVKIEHIQSPFDGTLGMLKSVYREGKKLMGKLSFPLVAWQLIDAAGAKRVSVAIMRDFSRISEVSLVRNPRVASAAIFASGEVASFSSGYVEGGSSEGSNVTMSDERRRELLSHFALGREILRERDAAGETFFTGGQIGDFSDGRDIPTRPNEQMSNARRQHLLGLLAY